MYAKSGIKGGLENVINGIGQAPRLPAMVYTIEVGNYQNWKAKGDIKRL
jgi:hypothetical protein